MEHPNSVVSREEIISAVWGSGAFVSGPAMNMQIKNLSSLHSILTEVLYIMAKFK